VSETTKNPALTPCAKYIVPPQMPSKSVFTKIQNEQNQKNVLNKEEFEIQKLKKLKQKI